MKDFHDLYSLVRLDVLDGALAEKAIQLVFHHRKTALKKLPVVFGQDAFEILEKNWSAYLRKIKAKKGTLKLPEFIQEVVALLTQWLNKNISL